jgi:hypothetical protein
VDDHFMGDSFPASGKPPRIRLRARGSKPIVRIELVRNNRYVYTRDYTDSEMERTFDYEDHDAPPAFYYVRVTQAAGEWAWSSPVWVDSAR